MCDRSLTMSEGLCWLRKSTVSRRMPMTDLSNCLGKFRIPPTFDIRDACSGQEGDGICVVAVVGKSRLLSASSKASLINSVLNSDVFMGQLNKDSYPSIISQGVKCHIEGSYDSINHVLFLHLVSLYDMSSMAEICQQALENIGTKEGYEGYLQSAEYDCARALLFIFSVSHIVLLHHPGSSFDVSYVKYFHILDTLRLKLQPHLTEVLRGLHLPKEWVLAARPCAPRVLFVFQSCTLDVDAGEGKTLVMSKSRSQKTPPLKRLQHAIEDQIYRILRKSRIITNISNNSLFAVPANQEFVYISQGTKQEDGRPDPMDFYLDHLSRSCSTASDAPRSHSYQAGRRGGHHTSDGTTQRTSPNAHTTGDQGNNISVGSDPGFRDFLWQHIELALSRGFDDNVGRNPVTAVFESPSLETWLEMCGPVYEFYLGEEQPSEGRAKSHFSLLRSLLHTNSRFSDGRCAKVLPIAEKAYQDGLPLHYTKSYHLTKLVQAKRVFLQHARGPACQQYLQQLEEDCTKYWHNGRQLCEQRSLTGNHCVNQLHRQQEEIETDDNAHLPVMAHSSQIKTRAACNCGRKQAEREDPFDYKVANYEWYEKQAVTCCSKLEQYSVAVFKPSTPDVKAGGVGSSFRLQGLSRALGSPSLELGGVVMRSPGAQRKDSTRTDSVTTAMSSLSLALSLGQSVGSDLYSPSGQNSFNPEASQDQAPGAQDPAPASHSSPLNTLDTEAECEPTAEDHEKPESPFTTRQHSTTEYLPSMINSDSPPGLLPKFSSWSVLLLAKGYNPTIGLDQPGFLHYTSFLLPWDMVLRSDRDGWPTAMSGKKYKQKKMHKLSESGEASIRLFVGVEYECPRGHRFFLSGPEKIFKAPASGIFKETAYKILHQDMPLYFPCHCRGSKAFVAQLMRMFVSIPEGSLEVTLNPRIQPGPSPCPLFYPSTDGPMLLKPGLWVIRFPYVYVGDSGQYSMPTDAQQLSMCKLLKGYLAFTELPQG